MIQYAAAGVIFAATLTEGTEHPVMRVIAGAFVILLALFGLVMAFGAPPATARTVTPADRRRWWQRNNNPADDEYDEEDQ